MNGIGYRLSVVLVLLFVGLQPLRAAVPRTISFQGRVSVAGVPFHGTGQFKLALIDKDFPLTYWRNSPDVAPADGVPDAAVSVQVEKGLYSVRLGDTSLPNMTASLGPEALATGQVLLRVWFSNGVHGFQQLQPDQPLDSVPYALVAETLLPNAVLTGPLGIGVAVPSVMLDVGGQINADSLSLDGVMAVSVEPGAIRIGTPGTHQTTHLAGTVKADRFEGDGSQLTGINGLNPMQVVTDETTLAQPNTAYVVNRDSGPASILLPTTANVGDLVKVSGSGTGGWTIQGLLESSAPRSWIPSLIGGNWVAVASSADGQKRVAASQVPFVGVGLLYTSTDGGEEWVPRESNRAWRAVASSADGTKLIAAVFPGKLYTSSDSGVTWTPRASDQNWTSVASSADGTKLLAGAANGNLYTSSDSGVTWIPRSSPQSWKGVASSADGTKLVAVGFGSDIFTSSDSGVTWQSRGNLAFWMSVASSADGTRLVAAVSNGSLYTSSDSGVTWVARASIQTWQSVASSADGKRLIAAALGQPLYESTDGGVTWLAGGPTLEWLSVASSTDGSKLAAAPGSGSLYHSDANSTLSGGPSDSLELRLSSDGAWVPLTPTRVDAANIASGTLPDLRLSENVALRAGGNAFTGDQTVQGTVAATAFVGDGSQLTGIPLSTSSRVVSELTTVAEPGLNHLVNYPNEATLQLPVTASVGEIVKVTGVGNGPWQISGSIAGYGDNTPWTAREAARPWRSIASSADGTRLIAAVTGGTLYTSQDAGASWVARDADRDWTSVASSTDGTQLIASAFGGFLYTSPNSGVNWVQRASVQNWQSVASSANGSVLVAAAAGGKIYVSSNNGGTWDPRESDRFWNAVTVSGDASLMLAADLGGRLYVSGDTGANWVPLESNRQWSALAASNNGDVIAAAVTGGSIYVSTDRGLNWFPRGPTGDWKSVAMSADGTRMVAAMAGGRIHTSIDSGTTWTARESQRNWSSVASSTDGNKLVAAVLGGSIYTSNDPVAFPGGGPGDSVEFLFTSEGNWMPVFTPAQSGRSGSSHALTTSQTIYAGSPSDPFPQLKVASASTAPYGAFLSLDATDNAGGKEYLIYSTSASAGEGTGKLVFQNFSDGKVIQTLSSGGNVGLGTVAPSVRLHVKQQTDNSGFIGANDGLQLEAASGEYWRIQTQAAGDLVFDSGLGGAYSYINRNTGTFSTSSDARFKRDVQPLGPLLDRVLDLQPVTFRYLDAPENSQPVVGFVAQQVLPLFPEVVDQKDDQYAIGYSGFGPIAIGALQELNAKLEAKLAEKDAELTEVKARLERLERRWSEMPRNNP